MPTSLGVPSRPEARAVARPEGSKTLEVAERDGSDPRTSLRVDGEWPAAQIVRRFGPAASDDEYLGRLLVACAALQGAGRVRELVERLQSLKTMAEPRVARLAKDAAIAPQARALEALLKSLAEASKSLPVLRARALNDVSDRPDGLRIIDLRALVPHAGAVALAFELSNKQNLAGVEYARAIVSRLPAQSFAEAWLGRALGSATMPGFLLFTPHEYGRVVVVHADGRLAYDPTPNAR